MSEQGHAGDHFDLDRIKQLIRMMEKHDLSEIKLEGGNQKWVLKRGGVSQTAPQGPLALPPGAVAAMQTSAIPAVSDAGTSAGSAAADEGLIEITSPTVGTFYGAPQPGDPPFVKVGDHVTPEKVVCIVEAMKVFNQIPAEVSGKVRRVLVQDGEAVEFGQALFSVKPD